ncbi:hypothetical protein AOLI_G00171840 [Acnodon oligacanthus]
MSALLAGNYDAGYVKKFTRDQIRNIVKVVTTTKRGKRKVPKRKELNKDGRNIIWQRGGKTEVCGISAVLSHAVGEVCNRFGGSLPKSFRSHKQAFISATAVNCRGVEN